MAYWGEAMSRYHQLWDFPNPATIQKARETIEKAGSFNATTDRERGYIAAAGALYQDNSKLSHIERVERYSQALAELYRKYPDDVNAGAFYALSLVALAHEGEVEAANRKKAIAILNPLFAAAPDNPGVAHYLIHAADTPELAPQGLAAARRYAQIAPDSSHALHMPSHIFIRLGLWQEAIASNVAAAASASRATRAGTGDSDYEFHAMDFLNYAYLQSGQESRARQVAESVKDVAGANSEEISDNHAILSARIALDLHRWEDAVALPLPAVRPLWHDSTYFARTIGAARSGNAKAARENSQNLQKAVAQREGKRRNEGYKTQADKPLDLMEAEAWVDFVEARSSEAIDMMRAGCAREKQDGVDATSIPACEMLGDLYVELKRPAEALDAYKTSLAESPGRFDSLDGAALSAQLLGNKQLAHDYFAKLLASCDSAADRPELAGARVFLAQK